MESLKSAIEALFGSDVIIQQSVIQKYSEQIQSCAAIMEENQKMLDKDTVRKEAHKLKSSSSLLGFQELSEELAALEHQLKSESDSNIIDELLAGLSASLLRTEKLCAEYLKSLQA